MGEQDHVLHRQHLRAVHLTSAPARDRSALLSQRLSAVFNRQL